MFSRRAKLHSELNKCQKLLLKIQALLHDAEEKQLSDPLVKFWLNELKDLAFDLEDIQVITSERCDESDLNFRQVKLKEKLSGKKFLLVLDDVWNENYELWDIFRRPFIVGDPRSKIIVTTRNEGVASIMGIVAAYHLKVLSNDDCFLLFTRHALGTRNVNDHSDLKLIGEKIVRKCKGLPLAAKVIGGLLRTKLDYSKWEIVLNSKVWDFPEEKSGIIPALLLSYHHLPSHLKQLFVYCSIFPKGYKYDKDELIFLWMAEGFLPHQSGNKLPEDVGCYYFNELLARSFFEKSSSKESRYVMHDLINDLAKYIAQNMYFNLDDEWDSNEFDTILPKTRHVTFTRQTYEVLQRFKDCLKMKSLRTLIALPIHASSCTAHCYLSNAVLQEILPRLRYLRSLCLSGYCIEDLPDSIGDLKHLRYLNVSRCKIKLLPESVSNLVNLQALRLRGCTELTKLPTGIKNLINLCYLDIRDTNCLKEMPPGICNLTNLRILPKFIVGKNNPLRLRELKNLSHLRGELSIYGLHNVVDIIDARIANLNGKDGLLELAMEWSDNFDDSRNEQDEMCTLNFLQPNRSIEKLGISHYGGTEFPSWIGDPSFTNIMSIHYVIV